MDYSTGEEAFMSHVNALLLLPEPARTKAFKAFLGELNIRQAVFKKNLIKIEGLPSEVIALMATDENPVVRRGVAEHLNVPVDVLVSLTRDEDRRVSYAAYRNPLLPVDVIEAVAANLQKWDASFLALNPSLPLHVAEQLLSLEDDEVDNALAENPNLPESIQLKLVAVAGENALWSLADNVGTSATVFRKLRELNISKILHPLSQNPACPVDVHMEMVSLSGASKSAFNANLWNSLAAHTPHVEVLEYMNEKMLKVGRPLTSNEVYLMVALASNKLCSTKILNGMVSQIRVLSETDDADELRDLEYALGNIVEHPNLTVELLLDVAGITSFGPLRSECVERIAAYMPYKEWPFEWVDAAVPNRMTSQG